MRPVKIAPSLLAANLAYLGDEVKAIDPFADIIHVDVMDGHFVPNLSFGAGFIKALRPYTSLPLDIHLMVNAAELYVTEFAQAGANILTIHIESTGNLLETLQKIKNLGCKAGIAINPETPIEALQPFLHFVDLILVMTVNPGFCGQSFLKDQLAKIQAIRNLIDSFRYPIVLEVDGGISPITAPAVVEAGADILVAGSSIFRGDAIQYADNIQALRGKSASFEG